MHCRVAAVFVALHLCLRSSARGDGIASPHALYAARHKQLRGGASILVTDIGSNTPSLGSCPSHALAGVCGNARRSSVGNCLICVAQKFPQCVRGTRPVADAFCQQSSPPPPAVAGAGRGAGLNAVDDFGASGKCRTNSTSPLTSCVNDGPALQRAIDAAQMQRRTLFIPAGQYMISAPLIVRSNANKSQLIDGDYLFGPLKMVGEGKYLTSICLSRNATAVIYFPQAKGAAVDAAFPPTTNIEIFSLSLDSYFNSDYVVLAPGLTRSHFYDVRFRDTRLVGLSIPYGWINRVEDCTFPACGWGGPSHLYPAGSKGDFKAGAIRMDYANNLDIVNSNFEGNGYGIFLGGGESIRITGNDIEGTAGAGVHLSCVSGVTVSGNYFESEDDLGFGGPAFLRPGGYSKGPNLPVYADIILNGIAASGQLDTYANTYPVNNAVLLNNYHSNGASPDPTMPSSAVLAIAVVGLTIEGAVCSQPAYPGTTGHCPGPNPLLTTGTDGRDFTVPTRSLTYSTHRLTIVCLDRPVSCV